MGHYIIKYKDRETDIWAVYTQEKIKPFKDQQGSLVALIQKSEDYLQSSNLAESPLQFKDLDILPPVSAPLRLICQGVNYASHREESALSKTSKGNVLFSKDHSSITGAFDPVRRPKDCLCLDYEVELGLIIKQDINHAIQVTSSNLHEYIAGLIIANDLSPRDLQYKDDYAQWFKGKSCRTMLPLGPMLYLLDASDFKHLNNLDIKLWVNGELRQDANTSQLIFKPAETLTEISTFMDLSVGDLLLTGTPGGVVLKAPSKFLQGVATWLLSNEKKVAVLQKKKDQYLQDGDLLETHIASPDGEIDLGRQTNKIIAYDQ